MHHDLVQPVVAVGQHAATLHRRAGLAVHAVLATHGDGGGARGGIDVAGGNGSLLEQVVAEGIVHQGGGVVWQGGSGIGPGRGDVACGHRIDHGRQRFVIDGDGSGEVQGLGAGRCNAGGDGLADEAHLVGRQHRPGRRPRPRRLRHHADRLDLRQVGGGEDPGARLGRNSDRADQSMGMRAADEHDLLRAAQNDVGNELATAAQVAIILRPAQRRPDAPMRVFARSAQRCADATVPMVLRPGQRSASAPGPARTVSAAPPPHRVRRSRARTDCAARRGR